MKLFESKCEPSDMMLTTGPSWLSFINQFGHLEALEKLLDQSRSMRFIKISEIGLKNVLMKK